MLCLSLRQIYPGCTQANLVQSLGISFHLCAWIRVICNDYGFAYGQWGYNFIFAYDYEVMGSFFHKLKISGLKITISPAFSRAYLHVAWQAWIQDVLQLYGQLLVSLGSSKFVHAAFKIAFTTDNVHRQPVTRHTMSSTCEDNGKTSIINTSRKATSLEASPADQLRNCVRC